MRTTINTRLALMASVALAAEGTAGLAADAEAAAATDATVTAATIIWGDTESGKKIIEAVKGKDGIGGYRAVFDDFTSAATAVQKAVTATKAIDSNANIPVVVAGIGDAAGLTAEDVESFNGMKFGVTIIGAKDAKKTGMRGLAMFPAPTLDDFMAEPAGLAWLNKIVEKEVGHVALRHLRNVPTDSPLDALYQIGKGRMPVSVAAYAEEAASRGLNTSAFDTVWPEMRKGIKKSLPALADALNGVTKPEIINAIRSAAFASENFADLENPPKGGSIFVWIAGQAVRMIDALNDDALDSSEIEAWVAGRDTLVIESKERAVLAAETDISSFNL